MMAGLTSAALLTPTVAYNAANASLSGANKVKEGLTDMELFENVTNLLHTYDAPVRASNDELSGIMLSNPENKLFKTNYVRNDMNNIL